MKRARQAQVEFQVSEMSKKAAAEKKQNFETKNNGKIPAYLKRFRKEEEEELKRTREEIQLNKRPPNTRVVTAEEKERVIRELEGRKAFLNEGIKNMSVTLYTNRAQNQYKGYA